MKDKNQRAKVAREKVMRRREEVRKFQKEERDKERLMRLSKPKQDPIVRSFDFGEKEIKQKNEDIVKINLQKCIEMLEAYDTEVTNRNIKKQQMTMATVEKENLTQKEMLGKIVTQEMIDE